MLRSRLGLSCIRLLSVFGMSLVVPWVNANHIPDTLPNQVVKVIEGLPVEQFRFSFNPESNSSDTLLSVCEGKQGRYGLVPFNTTAPLCWIYNSSNEQLISINNYDIVLASTDELNSHIGIFLEHQPDSNKGIWTSRQQTVCYSPQDDQEARSYCLKSLKSLKSSEMTTTETPAATEKRPTDSAGAYALLTMGVILVGAMMGFLEYKVGCIRDSCREYRAM